MAWEDYISTKNNTKKSHILRLIEHIFNEILECFDDGI